MSATGTVKHQISGIQVSIWQDHIRLVIQVIYLILVCVHVQFKAFFSQGKLSLSAKLLSAAVEAEVESEDENVDDIDVCYMKISR